MTFGKWHGLLWWELNRVKNSLMET